MLNLAQFRLRFPEFKNAIDALVTETLARATAQIEPEVWGSLTDEGHGLLTAHLLAMAPNGQMARLQTEKGQSTYGTAYRQMREQVTALLSRAP